jgi:EmrB/QacA subfamily drug resistance transporter
MIAPRQRNVALLVASCFFMQNLDGTIVTTAAPRIGASLHVPSLQVSLIITAYLVTFAILIPLGGWLVARLGTRKVFLGAIVVFTVASLLCALSVNLQMLIAMRILQGIGAAMMTPTGRIVALTNVEKRDLLRIMSFIIWPSLIAPVLAPLVGGFITTYASWRWIFLINIPLGVFAFLIGLHLMPAAERPPRQRLDVVGVTYTAIGLGGLTYTAHLLSISTSGAVSGAYAIVSLAFIAAAVWHLLRTPAPLLGLRVFAIQTFRASNSGITLFTIVVGSVPFLLPLLFETVFGWNAIKSGAVVISVFVGNIGIKPATTSLLNAFGFRRILVASTACVAVSMVAIGLFGATTPIALIVVILIFGGAARSMGFTAYMSLGYSDVPEAQMRDANVLAATVQQLSQGLAIAAGAVALHVGGAITAAAVKHPAPVNAYTAAFLLLACVALVACAMAFHLPINAGDSARATVVASEELEPTSASAASS